MGGLRKEINRLNAMEPVNTLRVHQGLQVSGLGGGITAEVGQHGRRVLRCWSRHVDRGHDAVDPGRGRQRPATRQTEDRLHHPQGNDNAHPNRSGMLAAA